MRRLALEIGFVAAAGSSESFPRLGLPEVALVGRSNVGKSSFLNALAGGRSVARTSRWPGRTRTVNFYRAGTIALVDLPGYGYAQVSKEERNRWKIVIESYLSRSEVRATVQLVDARTGPSESDRTMMEWVRSRAMAALCLVTKVDKVRRGDRARIVADVVRTLGLDASDVQLVSAVTGEGVKDAWDAIRARIG